MKITKITIVCGGGTDKVLLDTTLPNGVYPFIGVAKATIEVAAGNGTAYVAENFPGIETVLVDRSAKK